MPDNPFAGAGGGATPDNPFAGSPATTAKRSHGLLDTVARYSGAEFAGNAVSDLGHTALGVLPGLYTVGKATGTDLSTALSHPQDLVHRSAVVHDVVKPTLKQYQDYYGHDLGSHLYHHPVQAAVDALTLFSGGLSAGAKVATPGTALARLETRAIVETRSPKNVYTGKGPVVKDITSTKPVVHLRETAAERRRRHRVETSRPGGTLGFGTELKRYGQTIQAETQKQALARSIPLEVYQRATKGLSSREWSALHIRSFGVHPDQLTRVWAGTKDGEILADPKVRALVLGPSKKMQRAEPVAESFANENLTSLHLTMGGSADSIRTRPGLVRRQVAELLDEPARPIPGGPEPYYVPHTTAPVKGRSPLARTGGGKAQPRVPGTTKRNESLLFGGGRLHLRSDVLGPEFLRRVKYIQYDEVHDALVRGAVPQTAGQIAERGGLPAGWEYVREKSTTRIPHTAKGETDTPLESLIPDPSTFRGSLLPERFTTETPRDALGHADGRYLIVPKATAKAATGEFTRSGDFVYNFVHRPLAVWRAVVLGLRVGFLTNNLVGNSIMYAVKTAGRGGLRDLFAAIVEAHGKETGLRILKSPATPPELRLELERAAVVGPDATPGWDRPDFYKRWYPEQIRGTLGLTQSPSTGITAGVSRVTQAGRTVTGAIPRLTSKLAEEYPRRALIRNMIRNSPEFKKVWKALPRQERTFEAAAEKIHESVGGRAYQRMVSKQVNDALGDYLGLNQFERGVMRNTLPFYSWYKAISTVTFHLAADTPLRANVLGRLGQIGSQQSEEALRKLGHLAAGVAPVPSFLEGAIGLGEGPNGTVRALSTQGANPYATLAQLSRGAVSDVNNLGANPFALAILQSYARATEGGKPVSPAGLARGAALGAGYGVVSGLPPVRLAFPQAPSKLYPNRGRISELYSFAGVPVKEYRPAEAARQKRENR